MEGLKTYLLAVAAAGALAGPLKAAEPTSQSAETDLNARMNTLQAELSKVKSQLDEQKKESAAKEQQAVLDQTLKAADSQSQMLDITGMTAGYDHTSHRFFVSSDDGNFVWRPWLHMQFRDVTLDRQDFYYKTKGKDEIDNGFEMRRMRFGFDGNMFGKDLTYFFNWATVRANGNATVKSSTGATVGTVPNNLGGAPLLEEAWVKYNFHGSPWYIWAGQIKDPVAHDQIVSSRYQHGIERSVMADIFFNGDAFTEGATLIYDQGKSGPFRAQAGVNHGMRSANTNFFDAGQGSPANTYDYGVVGRAEYKFFGRWQDYGQIGAIEIKEPLLVAGVGTDYSSLGHINQTVSAADVQYADPGGLSLFGEFANRYTTRNFGIYTQSPTGASIGGTATGRASEEYGVLAEVGYVINNHIEPYGRVEYMHLQGTVAGSNNWVQIYTAGVNFYFYGNRLKLTPQVIYLPKGIPIDDGPSDIFTSAPGKAEIMGAVQLQLLI